MNFGMNVRENLRFRLVNVQAKIKYGSTCCQFFQIEYVACFVNFAIFADFAV